MGDLIINRRDGRGNRFDATAAALIGNHNLQTQIDSFQAAAKRMARPKFIRKSLMAPNLVDACQCIEDLLELPVDIRPVEYELAVDGVDDQQITEVPEPVLMSELLDMKVKQQLAEAKSRATAKSWLKLNSFRKSKRKN